LTDILLCVDDVAEVASRYERFLGVSTQARGGVALLQLARGRLHPFDRASLARLAGIEAPTTPFIAGFALTSGDLGVTLALLAERGVATRTLVPDVIAATPDDLATTILFTAPDATLPWLGS
jgi:hypothetical protein